MAGGATRRAASAALNYISGTALDFGTTVQTMYLALLSAPPPEDPLVVDLAEITTSGASRQPVYWNRAAGTPPQISNSGTILFGPFTGTGGMGYPATHVALIGVGVPENTANLLPANVAGIETSAAGWTSALNATIARSTAQFKAGTASLATTITAIGDSQVVSASAYPVTPLTTYSGSLWVYSAAGVKTAVDLMWQDLNGTTVSTTSGTQVTLAANTWTQVSRSGTCPPTARQVKPRLRSQATAAEQVAYYDEISVVPTATQDVVMTWQLDTVANAAQGESVQFTSGALSLSMS